MTETLRERESREARALLDRSTMAFNRAAHYRALNDRTGERQCWDEGAKCYREGMSWLKPY